MVKVAGVGKVGTATAPPTTSLPLGPNRGLSTSAVVCAKSNWCLHPPVTRVELDGNG